MISDNSSLHASSNTGNHSHSNGSWRNAPEVFLCTERPEETDWWISVAFCLVRKSSRQSAVSVELRRSVCGALRRQPIVWTISRLPFVMFHCFLRINKQLLRTWDGHLKWYDAVSASKLLILAIAEFDFSNCWLILATAKFDFSMAKLFQPSLNSTLAISLCPKSPSVRGFVTSLPVRPLFKYLSHNAFYPVSSLSQCGI